MATLRDVIIALQATLRAACLGLVADDGSPLVVQIGYGWPPERDLTTLAALASPPPGQPAQHGAFVSVFDLQRVINSTRWTPEDGPVAVVDATLSAIVVPVPGQPGAAQVTLAGTVTPGDAVSLVAHRRGIAAAAAQVAVGTAGDAPATMAAQLAALVNADPEMSLWVSVVAAGAVLTVTSLVGGGISYDAWTGNGGSRVRSLGTRRRWFKVPVWVASQTDRFIVCEPITRALAELEMGDGLAFPEGSVGRVLNDRDFDLDDATVAGVYRHDFELSVEYPITTTDQLYAVLAPVFGLSPVVAL